MIKTVSLTADTETKVEISGGYNVGVINRTTGMLYASRKSGVVAGADDVAAIPAGDSYVIRAADDTVYLLATAAGDVQLESIGAKEVFKIAAARTSSGGGEGGTVDEVARQAIASHANNEDIHLTAEKAIEAAATAISNPNLLINSDFSINQRNGYVVSSGIAYYSDTDLTNAAGTLDTYTAAAYVNNTYGIITVDDITYYVAYSDMKQGYKAGSTAQWGFDRWKVQSGLTCILEENGLKLDATELTTNHWIFQIFEKGPDFWLNKQVCLSVMLADGTVYSALGKFTSTDAVIQTAEFDEIILRWQITNKGIVQYVIYAKAGFAPIIAGAKLELGSVATPFIPPDPATELAKCQRYYQIRTTGDIDPIDLRPSMRTITDIRERDDGNYEYIAEL